MSTFYYFHSSLHTIHCTIHRTLYTGQFKCYTVHCTVYTVTVYSILYSLHSNIFLVHCTLYTVHCALYTVLCTLYFFSQSCIKAVSELYQPDPNWAIHQQSKELLKGSFQSVAEKVAIKNFLFLATLYFTSVRTSVLIWKISSVAA